MIDSLLEEVLELGRGESGQGSAYLGTFVLLGEEPQGNSGSASGSAGASGTAASSKFSRLRAFEEKKKRKRKSLQSDKDGDGEEDRFKTDYDYYSNSDARAGFEFVKYISDIDNWKKFFKADEDPIFFTYELPLLEVGAEVEVVLLTIPIFGVIRIDIAAVGEIILEADLGFGFDAHGIVKSIETGNPSDVLDGFYISDFDSNGEEKPEFTIDTTLALKATLDALIAEVGIKGGINIITEIDLQDVNDDGKIRVSELETMWNYEPPKTQESEDNEEPSTQTEIRELLGSNQGLLNLFNIDVEGNFILDVNASVVGYDYEDRLLEIPIFEWEYNAPKVTPVLASGLNGEELTGVSEDDGSITINANGNGLRLNMGKYAEDRKYLNTKDGNEKFIITGDDSGNVTISFGEWKTHYYNVGGEIHAWGGKGNDVIDASGLNDSYVTIFHGGEGKDKLLAGLGTTFLYGDEGDDVLDGSNAGEGSKFYGGSGNDKIIGTAYADVIVGNSGADKMQGGAGWDYYRFGNGFGKDFIDDNVGGTVLDFAKVSGDLHGDINFGGARFSVEGNSVYAGKADIRRITASRGIVQLNITNFAGPLNTQNVIGQIERGLNELVAELASYKQNFLTENEALLESKIKGTDLTVAQLLGLDRFMDADITVQNYLDSLPEGVNVSIGGFITYMQEYWFSTLFGDPENLALQINFEKNSKGYLDGFDVGYKGDGVETFREILLNFDELITSHGLQANATTVFDMVVTTGILDIAIGTNWETISGYDSESNYPIYDFQEVYTVDVNNLRGEIKSIEGEEISASVGDLGCNPYRTNCRFWDCSLFQRWI